MFDPDVRLAGPADHAELRRLEELARDAAAESRGGVRWLSTNPPLDWGNILDDARSEAVAFVAELAPISAGEPAVPVGLLAVDAAAEVATVRQVFVEADARELGFGDALIAAATSWATAYGCRVLEGQALPGDRHTKNLYERAGITARLITVSRRLGVSDPSTAADASR